MLLLAGCSLAPVIAENTLDYNTAVETVTNGVLVSNILRARDGAPLYFSDLSQIRGAVQFSLQAQTTLPYGPVFPALPEPRRRAARSPSAVSPASTSRR